MLQKIEQTGDLKEAHQFQRYNRLLNDRALNNRVSNNQLRHRLVQKVETRSNS